MKCADISTKEHELYNVIVGIIIAQKEVLAMKRPVPLYDFNAFGQAIKAARMERKESRKDVCDAMNCWIAMCRTAHDLEGAERFFCSRE